MGHLPESLFIRNVGFETPSGFLIQNDSTPSQSHTTKATSGLSRRTKRQIQKHGYANASCPVLCILTNTLLFYASYFEKPTLH